MAEPTDRPPTFPADLRSGAWVMESGFVPEVVTGERVIGRLRVGPEHQTPWGVVHGGTYATVIETVASLGASAAVYERGQFAVGLTNTTQFLRSLEQGDLLVEARPLHQGRSQQLWAVDITDERNRLIAHGELRLLNQDLPDA
jgi:1,4-dihydroxy-2-naphthoyl-CoA hydrolase